MALPTSADTRSPVLSPLSTVTARVVRLKFEVPPPRTGASLTGVTLTVPVAAALSASPSLAVHWMVRARTAVPAAVLGSSLSFWKVTERRAA